MVLRVLAGLTAAVLLVIGGIALTDTVTVPSVRRDAIGCGSGLAPDSSRAVLLGRAEEFNNQLAGKRPGNRIVTYTRACDDAISARRLWAWPLAGLGALGLLVLVVRQVRRSPTA
jgi:hypothetical protein